MDKSKVNQAFELIRQEAVDRMKAASNYPGLLFGVSMELNDLILFEMAEFRLAVKLWKKHNDKKQTL